MNTINDTDPSPSSITASSSSIAASSSSLQSASSSPSHGRDHLPQRKCISKNKVKKASHDSQTQEEILSLINRLKELVPNVPRNKRLSKLEVIQHVIDYIYDLQIALESRPSPAAAHVKANNSSSSSNRQPLSSLPSAVNYH